MVHIYVCTIHVGGVQLSTGVLYSIGIYYNEHEEHLDHPQSSRAFSQLFLIVSREIYNNEYHNQVT